MELKQNFDEFFAIRAQKYVTMASRSIRTASNNLAQMGAMAVNPYGRYKTIQSITNSIETDLSDIYARILDVELKMIELIKEVM